MIRHTVLFKFKPDFPPADKQAWIAGLNKMTGNIPGMLSLTHGPDLLNTERSFDYAIVADFEKVEDIAVYNTHPLHEPLKAYSFPNSQQILAVDFHLGDSQPAATRDIVVLRRSPCTLHPPHAWPRARLRGRQPWPRSWAAPWSTTTSSSTGQPPPWCSRTCSSPPPTLPSA